MDRIVVGIDGSEGSAAALRWALAEAQAHQATVVAVHAWSLLSQPDGTFSGTYGESDARAYAEEAVGAVAGPGVGADIEIATVCELPAKALLEAAADADLLVVGARGLGGIKELLLGSVSTQCVHHAPVPVVVVRTRSG